MHEKLLDYKISYEDYGARRVTPYLNCIVPPIETRDSICEFFIRSSRDRPLFENAKRTGRFQREATFTLYFDWFVVFVIVTICLMLSRKIP